MRIKNNTGQTLYFTGFGEWKAGEIRELDEAFAQGVLALGGFEEVKPPVVREKIDKPETKEEGK